MKFQVYFLLGTSLSCLPGLALGQCVPVQDCAALGYTETSCPGNGVKCPFGNGWFCSGDESSICAENGFKYSCTGTGYAGGAGFACGRKYTQCMCASGYEWKNGSCQQQALNGVQGDLYYCDGKVVGIKAPGMNFFISVTNAKSDNSEVLNWNTAASVCQQAFCGKGQLPSKDQLLTIYNNKFSLNTLLSANGGTKLTENRYWSSSYIDSTRSYYAVNISDGSSTSHFPIPNYYYARPIMTSW